MTRTEDERLAVVETQMTAVQSDITEIKADVKSLILTQTQLALALAVKEAADKAHDADSLSAIQYKRWLIPVVATVIGIVFTILNFITRVWPVGG